MDNADYTCDQQKKRRKYLPGEIGGALVAAAAVACWGLSASAQALPTAESHNMRLLGHDPLQARSAYHGVIQQQGNRWIAYIGHHNGEAFNPLTDMMETNGNSIVDVTNPRRPVYLHHLAGDPTSGGSQMVQTCSGDDLPNGTPGHYYLLRTRGNAGHQTYDVTDPSNPILLADVTTGLSGTHKNWWECDTGIAYLVADLRPDWTTNRGLKIFDLSDPANPVFIRDFGMVGSEPGATEPPVRSAWHSRTDATRRSGLSGVWHGLRGGAIQIIDRDALLVRPTPHPTPANLLAPVIGQLNMPDYWGGHTAWAMHDVDLPEYEFFEEGTPRDFVILTSESTGNSCEESMEHMNFFVDVTDEAHPFPVANYQVAGIGGRVLRPRRPLRQRTRRTGPIRTCSTRSWSSSRTSTPACGRSMSGIRTTRRRSASSSRPRPRTPTSAATKPASASSRSRPTTSRWTTAATSISSIAPTPVCTSSG